MFCLWCFTQIFFLITKSHGKQRKLNQWDVFVPRHIEKIALARRKNIFMFTFRTNRPQKKVLSFSSLSVFLEMIQWVWKSLLLIYETFFKILHDILKKGFEFFQFIVFTYTLTAKRQIPKKRCFKTYCLSAKACQFSVL